jgi:hypothetical protein
LSRKSRTFRRQLVWYTTYCIELVRQAQPGVRATSSFDGPIPSSRRRVAVAVGVLPVWRIGLPCSGISVLPCRCGCQEGSTGGGVPNASSDSVRAAGGMASPFFFFFFFCDERTWKSSRKDEVKSSQVKTGAALVGGSQAPCPGVVNSESTLEKHPRFPSLPNSSINHTPQHREASEPDGLKYPTERHQNGDLIPPDKYHIPLPLFPPFSPSFFLQLCVCKGLSVHLSMGERG